MAHPCHIDLTIIACGITTDSHYSSPTEYHHPSSSLAWLTSYLFIALHAHVPITISPWEVLSFLFPKSEELCREYRSMAVCYL